MNFIFDTGASNVSISLTEAVFMYKNGYITDDDLGERSYATVADGSIVENMKLNLKSIEIGGITLTDVDAIVVSSLSAPLLLGQSAIQKIGKIEMVGDSLFIIGIPSSPIPSNPTTTESAINIMPTPVITWWDKVKIFFGSEEKIDELINAAKNAHENGMDERTELYIEQAIALKEKCWKPYAYYPLFQVDEYDRLCSLPQRRKNADLAVINYELAIRLNGRHQSFIYNDGDSITYELCRNNLCCVYAVAFKDEEDYYRRCKGLDYDKRPYDFGVYRDHSYNKGKLYNNLICFKSDLYHNSIKFIQELYVEQPNNINAIRNLSFIYAINEEYDKAEPWIEKLVKLDEVEYYFGKVWIEQRKGNSDKAIEFYEKVLEIDSNRTLAMNNLANELYKRNNYTKRAIGYHYETSYEDYYDVWGGWKKEKSNRENY